MLGQLPPQPPACSVSELCREAALVAGTWAETEPALGLSKSVGEAALSKAGKESFENDPAAVWQVSVESGEHSQIRAIALRQSHCHVSIEA